MHQLNGSRARVVVLVAVGAAALLSCDSASAPDDAVCPSAAVALCLRADSTRAVVAPAVADARSRSVAALVNATSRSAITVELTSLAEAISAGRISQARTALDRARAVMIAAQGRLTTTPGDAPDLAAIDLVLRQVQLAIQ